MCIKDQDLKLLIYLNYIESKTLFSRLRAKKKTKQNTIIDTLFTSAYTLIKYYWCSLVYVFTFKISMSVPVIPVWMADLVLITWMDTLVAAWLATLESIVRQVHEWFESWKLHISTLHRFPHRTGLSQRLHLLPYIILCTIFQSTRLQSEERTLQFLW